VELPPDMQREVVGAVVEQATRMLEARHAAAEAEGAALQARCGWVRAGSMGWLHMDSRMPCSWGRLSAMDYGLQVVNGWDGPTVLWT